MRGTAASLNLAGVFSTYPHPHITFIQAFAVETTITAILMAMIMALTDDGNGIPRGPLAPLLIGLLIAVIGASMGPLTGFALNPRATSVQNCLPVWPGGARSPLPVGWRSLTFWCRCWRRWWGRLSGRFCIASLSAAICRANAVSMSKAGPAAARRVSPA